MLNFTYDPRYVLHYKMNKMNAEICSAYKMNKTHNVNRKIQLKNISRFLIIDHKSFTVVLLRFFIKVIDSTNLIEFFLFNNN